MLAPEEENEAEVRREDQDRINQFARLNARLQENRVEREEVKVRGLTEKGARETVRDESRLDPTRIYLRTH